MSRRHIMAHTLALCLLKDDQARQPAIQALGEALKQSGIPIDEESLSAEELEAAYNAMLSSLTKRILKQAELRPLEAKPEVIAMAMDEGLPVPDRVYSMTEEQTVEAARVCGAAGAQAVMALRQRRMN